MKTKDLEKSGLLAVQLIRKKNHEQGHPFMINDEKLPAGQCYLEFPNGLIQLVKINHSKKDFEVVRELSAREIDSIKKLYQIA